MESSMMMITTVTFAGILSHHLYFKHGEHHLHAPHLALLVVVFPGIYVLIGSCFRRQAPMLESFLIEFVYIASLLLSITTYRILFHRTRHFPGPFLAGVTKWYHFFNVTRSDQHIFLHRLHERYGDFVRTGPNEITIFTPKAIPLIHAAESRCTKAAWYDNILPTYSIVTLRSREAHDARRRVWDHGYSVKALQKHEPTILQHAKLLADALNKRQDQEINITNWFEFYGFDVMGMVQYNQSFHMLETGESHWVLDIVKGGTIIMGYMTSLPWLIQIVSSLPFVAQGVSKYKKWAASSIRNRMLKDKPDSDDTLGWLLEDVRRKGEGDPKISEHDWNGLIGDMMAMVTGGTEPVVVAMVFLFYHLAEDPNRISRLRQEIRTLTSYSDSIQLQALPFLNALIYETFRLHPGIPSGGLRITPKDGLLVGDTYIPPNTTVLIPHYSLQRREDCFERAGEFVPERWTTQPHMIRDRTAFMPWGSGPYSCVGKNLGLMEIRIVTVLLVDCFDFAFAPGETGKRLHTDTLDCFAALPGPLRLKFKKRTPEAIVSEQPR